VSDQELNPDVSLHQFAKDYDVGSEVFCQPVQRCIWLDDQPNAKSQVWLRYCTSYCGCKAKLRFRDRPKDGSMVRTVERSGQHAHEGAPTKALQKKLVHTYCVEKGLTPDRARNAMHRDGVEVPIDTYLFKNHKSACASKSKGVVDSSVRQSLKEFVSSAPSGVYFGKHQIDEFATRIPFTIVALAAVAAAFMSNAPADEGIKLVIDGTYKVNAQKLVLLCIGVVGIACLASGHIVNKFIPLFFALAHVEDDGAYEFFLRSCLAYFWDVHSLDLSALTKE